MPDAMESVGMACSLGRSRRVPCGMGRHIFPVSVAIEELGEVVAGVHAHTLAAHGPKASAPKPWPAAALLGGVADWPTVWKSFASATVPSVVPRRCFMASRAEASAGGCSVVMSRSRAAQRCFQSSGEVLGRSGPKELALSFDQ